MWLPLVIALLSAAPAEDSAESLFKRMESKLQSCKTLQFETYHWPLTNSGNHVQATLGADNQSRVELIDDGIFLSYETGPFLNISNGTTTRAISFDRSLDAKKTIALELPVQIENQPTGPHANKVKVALLARGPYVRAFESIDPGGIAFDLERFLPISELTLGPRETVMGRPTQAIHYVVGLPTWSMGITDVTVWIDRETFLPLQRITYSVYSRLNSPGCDTVEQFSKFVVDGPVDVKSLDIECAAKPGLPQAGNPDPRLKTPESTARTYIQAKQDHDYPTWFACMSPVMLNNRVAYARAALIRQAAESPSAEIREKVNAFLKKHNLLDCEAPDRSVENLHLWIFSLQSIGSRVTDKVDYYREADKLFEELSAASGAAPQKKPPKHDVATLRIGDPTINGDLADLSVADQQGQRLYSLAMRRIDGSWSLIEPAELGMPDDDRFVARLDNRDPFDRREAIRPPVRACSSQGDIRNDRDAKAYSSFNTLRDLDLRGTEITAAGIASLGSHKRLIHLSLSDSPLGDECVPAISAFKELRVLDLSATNFTAGGIELLRAALPNCCILCGVRFDWGDPVEELRKLTEAGRRVGIVVYFDLKRLPARMAVRKLLEDPAIARSVRTSDAFVLDGTPYPKLSRKGESEPKSKTDPPVDATPRIEVYSPRESKPQVLRGEVTREQLLAALEAAGVPPPPVPKRSQPGLPGESKKD